MFYDTVRRVTGDGRIDMFSREKREGFDQWGNETGKFDERVSVEQTPMAGIAAEPRP